MVTKERGEELALFLDMRRREMDDDELHTPSPSESMPPRKTRVDEFLNSENDKSDYEWLLTPPGTPLFPPFEKDSQKPVLSQIEIPNARPTAPKSRLDKVQEEPASRSIVVPKQPTLLSRQNSSSNGNRRSSSSVGLTSATSRSATPTGRPTLPSKSKPSRSSTPVSHPTLPSKTKPSRSSTPPMVRSSTPTVSTTRSSTPTARPSLPTSKSTSRSATPNRGPSAPSVEPSLSAPPGRSSSAPKSGPTISKKPLLSRGSSPPVKSRPWKPYEIPGFSLDAPPNLRTSFPERPVSASKGRPGAPSARSSSIDSISNGKSRQQSSSPSRGRASHGSAYGNGKAILAKSRSRGKDNETDSPVLIGTKMVERVVNMRKLPPPKQDDSCSTHNEGSKSLSTNGSGFGRTLSNKSLDMALRHMDIRRSIPGKPRPSMTNIPASSIYSVRSSSTKKTLSAADSPLATSSNASSEPSIKNSSVCLDGSEIEDNDFGSEKGNSSPGSHHGQLARYLSNIPITKRR